MNGSVYKRCPCTETSGGKQQKKACKKSHGSWFYAHDVPSFDNERRPRAKRGGFPTKAAAEEALAESLARCAQRGVAAERNMSGRRQLLGNYLTLWLDGKPDIKPATRFSYADHISRFLIPHLGHLRLEDLAVSHISAMYAELRQPRPRPEKPRHAKKAKIAQRQRITRSGAAPRGHGALRASILAYLQEHPGEAFTGNRIAAALKAWPPPTRRALARLADLGMAELVSKDPCRYAAAIASESAQEQESALAPEPGKAPTRLSPASIQRIHATLRSALNDAVRQRMLDYNPAQLVRLEAVRRPRTRYWTGPEGRRAPSSTPS